MEEILQVKALFLVLKPGWEGPSLWEGKNKRKKHVGLFFSCVFTLVRLVESAPASCWGHRSAFPPHLTFPSDIKFLG